MSRSPLERGHSRIHRYPGCCCGRLHNKKNSATNVMREGKYCVEKTTRLERNSLYKQLLAVGFCISPGSCAGVQDCIDELESGLAG